MNSAKVPVHKGFCPVGKNRVLFADNILNCQSNRVMNSANIFEAGNLVSPLYFYCKTAACGLNGDSSAYFSAKKIANA